MDKIRIVGGIPLKGTIPISGAKNAALPLMAACLLSDQPLVLNRVPELNDIYSMIHLLETLGVSAEFHHHVLQLKADKIKSTVADYEIVRKMRASILVLGPLLARYGHGEVSLPGGCVIGTRPVDLHLRAFEEMGAEITLIDGYIHAKAPRGLKGADISFPIISVGATENVMMAACLAKGTTRLLNAAKEPEIMDLAECLNQMGAKIQGAGTDTIVIEGVTSFQPAVHSVIADRIEMGTYAIAGAITGGDVILENAKASLLPTFLSLLQKSGVIVEELAQGVRIQAPLSGKIHGIDVMTEPFPGYPTDLQAQWMALMSLCQGAAMITETIFENRFMHVPELIRMGAHITVHGASALVRGVPSLKGAPVMATDIRASSSLILAALAAEGETIINRVYHLDRGYEKLENKLSACGAMIERIKDNSTLTDVKDQAA